LQRRVNIGMVATSAGVGVGTVSRVLNDSPHVRESTRQRVLDVMAKLQYHPSRLATALSRGTTGSVAVMVTFLTQPSVVERLAGVISVLDEEGYDTVVFNVETAKQRDRHVTGLASQHRADGIIAVSLPLAKEQTETFKAAGLPVVIVDTDTPGTSRFVIDNVDGGRLATNHLLGLGHRRIAFVGDSGDPALGFSSSDHRLRGYRAALRDAGVHTDEDLVRITDGPRCADDGVSAAEALIANKQPPTAIFAASDVQAMRVLHVVEQRGLRVPDDISLIGFDDIEAAALARLSTVRQPLHESGVLAARRLCWLLDGNTGRPHRTVLPLEVIHRGSTSPPRHSDNIHIERARKRPPPTPIRASTAAKSHSRAATRSRRPSPTPPPSGAAVAFPGPG
jgi:DNA-binding LacI/PurR family transcriptional regulator